MTGNDIYNSALALLGEPESAQGDFDAEVVLRLINTALPLAFPYNNQLRVYRGKEELSSIPTVMALGETIDYEPEFMRNVLPYRLASDLAYADDEVGKAEYYNQMFQSTMEDFTFPVVHPVIDMYS